MKEQVISIFHMEVKFSEPFFQFCPLNGVIKLAKIVILWISAVVKTDPLLLLTPLSISCNCILSQVLHSVPCRPRGTSGAEGRWISSSCLSLIVSPVMHLTIVRSSSNLVVPWDNRGSSSFCVIAWKHPSNISYYKSLH